ncbi:hypothetical protein [Streptomyces sp. NPDC102462]|uniref:hypothetical protein n=1 Tax=Streptomyces sp. NPDC102462 TaxID=3366178 RepID=UPI0038293C4F
MSRSKAKGTAAETAVVRYLQAAGFAQAERRTLAGVQDRGDIAGIPGVVIEVKNCARQELPAWVAEAEIERDNDNATLGVVWHKLRGKSSPADWFVTMSGAQFAQLLREQQGLPAPAAERRKLLTLATPCAVCTHPFNWHVAGVCQFDDEKTRCDCIAFAEDGAA